MARPPVVSPYRFRQSLQPHWRLPRKRYRHAKGHGVITAGLGGPVRVGLKPRMRCGVPGS